MDDASEVERVAAEYVARHGLRALTDLQERAEMAAETGDRLSADAWTDIAEAAARLLKRNR